MFLKKQIHNKKEKEKKRKEKIISGWVLRVGTFSGRETVLKAYHY